MNCFYHVETPSVATCIDCGKGLCKDCASLYEAPICNGCNEKRFQKEKQSILKTYVVTGLLFIAGFAVGRNYLHASFVAAVGYGYLLAGVQWGWKVISFIQPGMFLFMSLMGWVIYFIIKFSLALFIGAIAMPIGIARNVVRHIKAQSKGDNIKSNMKNTA